MPKTKLPKTAVKISTGGKSLAAFKITLEIRFDPGDPQQIGGALQKLRNLLSESYSEDEIAEFGARLSEQLEEAKTKALGGSGESATEKDHR